MSHPPFQSLLDEHARPMLAMLRGLVGPDDAEDCFQDAVVAALRAYPPRESGNLRAWLLTIAHNKALDHLRARARRPLPVAHPPERPAPAPPDGDGRVWPAVAELPPKQRAALALRYAGDLSHREIGLALGCSEAAARRNVHEGIKRLQEVLG